MLCYVLLYDGMRGMGWDGLEYEGDSDDGKVQTTLEFSEVSIKA